MLSKNNDNFQLLKMKRYITIVLAFSCCFMATGSERYATGWLPSVMSESSANSGLDKLLYPVTGKFRILSCLYDEAILKECRMIKDGDTDWQYTLDATTVKSDNDAIDINIRFRRKGEKIFSAGVAVAFDIYNWHPDNYVMIPASVYNGNRNRIVDRQYAQGLDRSDLYRKDLPLTTCAVPQLSPISGMSSRIEVHSSNTTTPAMCFYDKNRKKAFIVLAEQGILVNGEIIDNGFMIEESNENKTATFVVSAPGVRERKPEFIGFGKSPDRGIDWEPNDELEIRLRVYVFDAADITVLFDRFMSVRKSVTGPNSPRDLIPMSEVFNIMTRNINKRYYEDDKTGFYCPENANWISFGWIGGLMNTFPMLVAGDETNRKKVMRTFDFAIPRAQGESGYFYGALNYDGKVFGREGYDETPEIVLTRKNADVLFWMIKQFMLMKAQGHKSAIKPEWEDNIKRLADAFVRTWNEHRQWGNFVNNKTGEIAVYNTTSGAMAIGGLILASEYYGNKEYLDIAKIAAEYYYKDFLNTGMTTGGCADILQNADSETAAALMTSLMTLYEYTGEKEWLNKSSDLANLCATWTVSFDYQLPPNTALAKSGAKLAGAVWASTQNKHGAPGFCTQAGESLFKIFRETGDFRYAELMRDIIHAHAEGIQPNGQITERLTYCDADSRGSRGDGGKTGWNETNGAMMAVEIPGIYLRKDIDRMYVFDHVSVKVLKRDNGVVHLEIKNPTSYDASVSILAEDNDACLKRISITSFLDWPKFSIKAGEVIYVKI